MDLLVTDFDGTFYDNNYKENIKFIKSIKNLDFVIATGRNFPSLKKDLKLECEYYICNDGGYILDRKLNKIYRNTINEETAKIIYNRIKKLKYKDYFCDNLTEFSEKLIPNINKFSIKIQNSKPDEDIKILLEGLDDVYAYISTNWINILSNESKKSKAIDYITKLEEYNKIYVIGNDINDFDMLKKYNGYIVNNELNGIKTLNNFLELKDIIKK